jgi:enamine deaminase RidA (YjgF/YER057c/UK114 family)
LPGPCSNEDPNPARLAASQGLYQRHCRHRSADRHRRRRRLERGRAIRRRGPARPVRQALRNILAILAEDGAGPEHIVRTTCYVTDIDAYRSSLAEIGDAWKVIVGPHYPAMALVGVTALVDPKALVEIEATAVVPE